MLFVFGAGGFALQLLDTLETRDELTIVTDGGGPDVYGHRHIAAKDAPDGPCVIAVSDPATRRRLSERFQAFDLRADTAIVSPHAEIGEGYVLCHHTVIEPGVRIGRHFHANVGSFVAHQCVIGDFVTFSPAVICNGNVHIADGVFVGAGAIIRNGCPDRPLMIGKGATIGMGAVVTRDVPPFATVIGNPARTMSQLNLVEQR